MRDLAWDGYRNARDLGGLPTPASTTGARGLATVVDLRCAHEIGPREGDPVVGPITTSTVSIVNAPTEDQDNAEFRETCFPILDSPEYWRHNWRILPDLVLGALSAIAAAPTGVLVQCSAGRDRTGMISTLLLSNAGVDPADVADDYAESVRVMAGAQTHSPTADRQAAWGPDEVTNWLARTVPIVEEIAAEADAAFDAIGAGPDLRMRLRALLTQ